MIYCSRSGEYSPNKRDLNRMIMEYHGISWIKNNHSDSSPICSPLQSPKTHFLKVQGGEAGEEGSTQGDLWSTGLWAAAKPPRKP